MPIMILTLLGMLVMALVFRHMYKDAVTKERVRNCYNSEWCSYSTKANKQILYGMFFVVSLFLAFTGAGAGVLVFSTILSIEHYLLTKYYRKKAKRYLKETGDY